MDCTHPLCHAMFATPNSSYKKTRNWVANKIRTTELQTLEGLFEAVPQLMVQLAVSWHTHPSRGVPPLHVSPTSHAALMCSPPA